MRSLNSIIVLDQNLKQAGKISYKAFERSIDLSNDFDVINKHD